MIVPWLKENYPGSEVVCFCADIGQNEDLSGVPAKAAMRRGVRLVHPELEAVTVVAVGAHGFSVLEVGAHGEDAAEGKAHQVEAFHSEAVGQLFHQFSHALAGEFAGEWGGLSVPGQLEEVDMEPLSHKLGERAPVFHFRDGGWHDDERFAAAGFQNVQAREGQVYEAGVAGRRDCVQHG